TTLDGLQGLADVKFINAINLVTAGFDTGATVLVAINNPSKLTLTVGDLVLNSGLNYTKEGYAGKSYIKDLVLHPGRNEVIAFAKIDMTIPVGIEILNEKLHTGFSLYLQPFIGSNKNQALDAGLQNLRQVLEMPPFMIGETSAKQYAVDWTLRVPDSAIEDGIAYVTTTVGNPFFSQQMNVVSLESMDMNNMAVPPTLTAFNKAGETLDFLRFIAPGGYLLKGNETKEITFAMKLDGSLPMVLLARLPELVETANTGGVVPLRVTLMPKVQVGNDPRFTSQDFTSANVYYDPTNPAEGLRLNLHIGPDIANVIKYLNKLVGTTVLPPVAPPTAVVPPVLVPSPSPTTTVALPPVTPTPTPGTSDPVASPSPAVASPSPVPVPTSSP
ncbi:hypothetical protein BG006_004424, partial [Podila minutissima]